MNIIFAGTPVFAERHLRALLHSKHNIVAVYTQPDRPAGRGKKLQASPVKQLALEHGIPVIQPQNFKSDESLQTLSDFGSDLMVVVAYGILLPKTVLETPKFGCINVHGSLLPQWRGAAPIQRAIQAGDKRSGVTIMQMDQGLDTGDMLLKAYCDIRDGDSSADLHDKLAEIGPPALLETIEQLEAGTAKPEKQDDSHSSYAAKIRKEEALINWEEPAEYIVRKVCAFNPFPVCFSFLAGSRIKIYAASIVDRETKPAAPGSISIREGKLVVSCGQGSLAIENVQVPGKKAMSVRDYLNGINQQLPAERFTNS